MTSTGSAAITVAPPHARDSNNPETFIEYLRSPWYHLIAELHDIIFTETARYAGSRKLKNLFLPMTTRTVTCPSASGSDSEPVAVTVGGVDTYLPDSIQFALEYGCRLAPDGCYTILPSFRTEQPDETHLSQYTHSEAELPGGLDSLIRYVTGYAKALAAAILDRAGDRLIEARGDVSHLVRMTDRVEGFEQLTFDEAAEVVADVNDAVSGSDGSRTLTRIGERLLMERVSEFVWVHHFDSSTVPFYHAFGDENGSTAKCADLYFGMGEVFGSGERHTEAEELRKSMALHGVDEADYAWYVRMKAELPMLTSGFGMGVDRFLMWVLNHHDIRDMPLISRIDEPQSWPSAIVRP
ncbi:amino acid--tRNA ligase-related protein [Nocardia sp. NPDC004573]